MAQIDETTYNEVRKCPKCGQPGEVTSKLSVRSEGVRPGTQAHIITCRTPDCPWEGEVARIIQVNPDGSIPPAQSHKPGRNKNYPVDAGLEEQINEAIRRQIAQEIKPGGGELPRAR